MRRARTDFTGAFGFFAYGVFVVVMALAIGVFAYDRILATQLSGKDAALKAAQDKINPATVESFVQLRDRLSFGTTLLANHVALSSFFATVGADLPTTVRFSSLHLSVDDAKKITLDGVGTAATFNALADLSTQFSVRGHIKDAIFSNITINSKDNSVSFSLSATIDPSTVVFSASAPAPSPSVGTQGSTTQPSL
jgi:hypothetical protein